MIKFVYVTNEHEFVPLLVSTSRSFPHSWHITGFVTRVTRRVSLVEQELLTLLEYLSSPPFFSEVHVARSLFFCVVFCRSLSVLFRLAIVLSVLLQIYWFWLHLCHLQTFLVSNFGRSVVFSGYSSFPRQYNWPPPYNWNIVESGVKHHNPNPELCHIFVLF